MADKQYLFNPSDSNCGGHDLITIEKGNHKAALLNSKSVIRIKTPQPHVDVWKKKFLKTQPLSQPTYFIDPSLKTRSYKEIPKGVDISQPKSMGFTHLKLRNKNNVYGADDHKLNVLSLSKHLSQINQRGRLNVLRIKVERKGLTSKEKPKKLKAKVWKVPFPDAYDGANYSNAHFLSKERKRQKSKNTSRSQKRRNSSIGNFKKWISEPQCLSNEFQQINPKFERTNSAFNSKLSSYKSIATTNNSNQTSYFEFQKIKKVLFAFIVENKIWSEIDLCNLEKETILQYPRINKIELHDFFDEILKLVKDLN